MRIQEIFASDITRDIPPVVYFHETTPEKIADEVSEYIVTGGYPEGDPRRKRIDSGIHEQFVRLLSAMAAELARSGGPELPASWISGFYGSGKSSFAKLLGLALDGRALPDGRALSDVLLSRDDSPKQAEFRDAWNALVETIDPMAVVFDIGAMARDDEHIHAAVKRMIQNRLGYCPKSHYVAEYELKLELDGEWAAFLRQAEETLGHPWNVAKTRANAEDVFSELLHRLHPERFTDPMSWMDSRGGAHDTAGSSVAEVTRAIADMLDQRAPGKTLFLVVDEVSQYIRQNENRMLKLQSLVSDLGQKLKGRVWLQATGQQKLEEVEDDAVLGKLKDRFPPRLRVHLANANIRDVVHKRLLKKAPDKEGPLRELFAAHRSDLKLYGYACGDITEEDFVEVYPLLPGHVDLLMRITSALRLRSNRVKGDDFAIRGLLQMLGELFREQALGEKELGELITLDRIYDIQKTALDSDIQNTMERIFSHEAVAGGDSLTVRTVKAVALLELIQDQEATTAAAVAQCLYSRVGQGNQEPQIRDILQRLLEAGLLSYSEKEGYKLQSSAGEEWQRDRDSRSIMDAEIREVAAEILRDMAGGVDRPKFRNKGFPWALVFNHGTDPQEEKKLQVPQDPAVALVDFRFLKKPGDREAATWIQATGVSPLSDRIVWISGPTVGADEAIRALLRSRKILDRYASHVSSLPLNKQRLFYEEQSRKEELEKKASSAVAAVFLEGELFFRGRRIEKQPHGSTFGTVLLGVAERLLPELFDRFVDMAVTDKELKQLLEPNLSGPSRKFMTEGLGILEMDAGRYHPTCAGDVPTRLLKRVEDAAGMGGAALLGEFGKPPYGYAPDVVRACVAGLLRAGKIRIRPQAGTVITSVRDPGVQDLFEKTREFKSADILPPPDQGIKGRDRVQICKFFVDYLNVDIDRENDAIADAVFQHFPAQVARIQELERKWNQLPSRPELPEAIRKLRKALEDCKRNRHVEPTVLEIKKNLDTLRDGTEQLAIQLSELTDEALAALIRAMNVHKFQAAQLTEIDRAEGAAEHISALTAHLKRERPWKEINELTPRVEAIEEVYREVRRALIQRQGEKAEQVREKIKNRQGFEKLTADQSHHVLRPVTEALTETTPEAVQPPLEKLRDSITNRLARAEEKANERLDDILSKVTPVQVVRFPHKLTGREVQSAEEAERLVAELRNRLLDQMNRNPNIRIRLV